MRYVSSSIPLASIVALLLLSFCIISPDGFGIGASSSVYAEEDASSSSGEAVGGTEILNPTAELTVEGDLTQTTLAGLGSGPVYRSHNVSINVNDVTDYTLRVSYANNTNNALEYYGTSGDTVTTGGTTIGGVGNAVKSTSMPENSWGFGWSDNKDAGDNELDYYTMPNYGSNNTGLAGGVLANKSNNEGISNTAEGKLVFAANFKNDAVAGHYKTSVLLSLAATPKKVTNFSGLASMQDMTPSICESAVIGTTEESIIDNRDNSTYNIAKLADGNCWMTRNLKLDISKAGSLNSNNSNLAEDTTWPTEDIAPNVFPGGMVATWSNGEGIPPKNDSQEYNSEYGYYYSFCAATAGVGGTCSGSVIPNYTSEYSICPKGWRLPTSDEYSFLISEGGTWNTVNDVSGMTFKRNFLPAAGVINGSYIFDAGSKGYYWSSSFNDYLNLPVLTFDNSKASIEKMSFYYNFPIRCIAQTTADKISIKTEGFGGIKKLQDMTSDICGYTGLSKGSTGQLYDSRDFKIYNIAKLEDGKCWMTQNLQLDISKANSLTQNDSNIDNDWPNDALNSSNNGFSAGSEGTAKWNNGSNLNLANGSGAYDPRYGYYYNWCAATADRGRYCVGATTSVDNSQYSICPKGWRLPANNEYANITYNKTGDWNDGWTLSGGFFPAAGYISNGSLYAGVSGRYWSSTVYDSSKSYNLTFTSDNASTDTAYRYYGYSVRCIAE